MFNPALDDMLKGCPKPEIPRHDNPETVRRVSMGYEIHFKTFFFASIHGILPIPDCMSKASCNHLSVCLAFRLYGVFPLVQLLDIGHIRYTFAQTYQPAQALQGQAA